MTKNTCSYFSTDLLALGVMPFRNLSSRPDDAVIDPRAERQDTSENTKKGRKTHNLFTFLNISGSEPDVVPDFKKHSTCPAGDRLFAISPVVTLSISRLG